MWRLSTGEGGKKGGRGKEEWNSPCPHGPISHHAAHQALSFGHNGLLSVLLTLYLPPLWAFSFALSFAWNILSTPVHRTNPSVFWY